MRSPAPDDDLRRRREALCVGHMTAENAHDFDRAIAFFDRPRYELVATGEVYDGADRLGDLMHENVTAFPDFRFDVERLHHADEAIVVEGTFRGTHLGSWRGLPATGRPIAFPMVIVFPFDGDRMLGERLFFDLGTALRQLGVARDPSTTVGKIATALNHPVTVGRALLRGVLPAGGHPWAATLPPGSMGLPVIGETPAFLRDPYGFVEERQRRHGDVFRSRVLLRPVVFLAGLEGAEAFYDPENITRTKAHPVTLTAMFGGDNMEMFDGERHLALKTATLAAFDDEALERYLPEIAAAIDRALARIVARGEGPVVGELRRLAIDGIWTNVMGAPGPGEAEAIASDYAAVVKGITSVPLGFLPGTPYRRALGARARLLDRIGATIRDRRAAPTGDGLSRMLAAGPTMTDREARLEVHHFVVAGFVVYLLLAEVLRRLAEQPEIAERCEQEIRRHVGDGTPSLDDLGRLTYCTNVVREAKRIVPIVPFAFGRARRPFDAGGYRVPQGWNVYLALHLNNHDPRVYEDPARFDPDRFSPDRAEHDRHPMAFIPQGAEPPTGHRCLGLDYSTVLVLAFLARAVSGYRWTLPPQDLTPDPRAVPPEPKDGLRVRLRLR